MTLVLALIFLDLTPKAKAMKAKINTWDYIKLSSCCRAKKKKTKENKRQPTEWEKIFPNHISDEKLIPKIHKEGNGNPLQYSCLENPMDRGAWWATVHGVAKESDTT